MAEIKARGKYAKAVRFQRARVERGRLRLRSAYKHRTSKENPRVIRRLWERYGAGDYENPHSKWYMWEPPQCGRFYDV
ncbi:hypothetical protein [Streptomyces sp. URMC 125]|uniref:hypothetical protein n=1 Tax=Streptomyces sp. URMC 125 TaxID=3423419 RepID=UPI003F5301B8